MNKYETMLFVGFIASYLTAFSLFHLMIFRVNRYLLPDCRIPHFLHLGGRKKLAKEYAGFYPRSFLYRLTLTCAVTCLIIAVGFAGLRVWEYAISR